MAGIISLDVFSILILEFSKDVVRVLDVKAKRIPVDKIVPIINITQNLSANPVWKSLSIK